MDLNRLQSEFIDWCRFRSIGQPAPAGAIVHYLDHVMREHGPEAMQRRAVALFELYKRNYDCPEVFDEARRMIGR